MIHPVMIRMALLLKRVTVRLTLAAGVCLFPLTAAADEPSLTDIIVTNTDEHLLVYLTVEGAFSEPIKQAVMDGAAINFTFYFKLVKSRSLWYDKTISDLTVTHKMVYDREKQAFRVSRSWDPEKERTVSGFEEAAKRMCEIDSLKLAPVFALEKGQSYQIRTKAQLSRRVLPLSLDRVVSLVSSWNVETDWYAIDFIY